MNEGTTVFQVFFLLAGRSIPDFPDNCPDDHSGIY